MKMMKDGLVFRTLIRTAALGVCLVAASSLSASVLMTESFDYAAGNLAGNNGGVGWGGAWTETDPDGTATVVSGLSFSDMPVSGGAAEIQITSNDGFKDEKASRASGVSVTTGDDLWVSFLYTQPGAPLASNSSRTAELRHSLRMRIKPKNSGSQGVALRYDSAGATATNGTQNIQNGDTFLVVARFGDIGQASGKVALMWVLDAAGYDSVKAGGVTQAELDSANILSLSSPHANQSFGIGDAVDMVVADSSNTSFAAVYDELRYGTTSQDVVAVVPEPASLAMLGLGCMAMLKRRQQ